MEANSLNYIEVNLKAKPLDASVSLKRLHAYQCLLCGNIFNTRMCARIQSFKKWGDIVVGCVQCSKRLKSDRNDLEYLNKLSEKFSNRLFDTVDKIYRNIIPDDVIDTIVTKLPLTVFQANKGTKKCNVYKCISTQIPYSGAAVTLGRKTIRDLCGLKSFSDISYN